MRRQSITSGCLNRQLVQSSPCPIYPSFIDDVRNEKLQSSFYSLKISFSTYLNNSVEISNDSNSDDIEIKVSKLHYQAYKIFLCLESSGYTFPKVFDVLKQLMTKLNFSGSKRPMVMKFQIMVNVKITTATKISTLSKT